VVVMARRRGGVRSQWFWHPRTAEMPAFSMPSRGSASQCCLAFRYRRIMVGAADAFAFQAHREEPALRFAVV